MLWAEFAVLDATNIWMMVRGVYVGAGTHFTHELFRTTDGGLTWTAAAITTVDADAFSDDKEYLAVGPDMANLSNDIFVVAWQERGVIYAATSDDGLTWNAPVRVSNATGGGSSDLPRSSTAICRTW